LCWTEEELIEYIDLTGGLRMPVATLPTVEQLKSSIMKLKEEERDELLRLVLQETQPGPEAAPEIDAAFIEEVKRRDRDLAEGRVQKISFDQAIAGAREKLQEKSAELNA